LGALYRGQLLVHGLGYSPDGQTLAVVSIASNSVTLIDTATNTVKKTIYVGRAPHEPFFTPDGRELWVTVRGEDYISVIDPVKMIEVRRIQLANGPGMTMFGPDGRYGFVCSSFTPELDVIDAASYQIVKRITQASPFCPNIAVSPENDEIWITLKDAGKVQVFSAKPPFEQTAVLETGPITNHVNLVNNLNGKFAYVTIGGANEVKVFRRSATPQLVATIPVGSLPHGIWPSGDGTRMYVGLENADAVAAIDTLANKVMATIPIGQAPQGVAYVPNAVPQGDGMQNLQPLGVAAKLIKLALVGRDSEPATQVSLFDQGVVQVLQAAVTGLSPKQAYVLALSDDAKGTGRLEALAEFMTNPAGAAIVNTIGPIRQIIQGDVGAPKRYLVIATGTPAQPGEPVQVQMQP
jgi:YVTN family beta-propeller protein